MSMHLGKSKRLIIPIAALAVAALGTAVWLTAANANRRSTASSGGAGSAAASGEDTVYEPSVVSGNKRTPLEALFTVPNTSGCTNLGSMCIDGQTLYCIKTNGNNIDSVLFRVDAFESASRTVSLWAGTGLYHANGLTSLSGALYVATMQAPDPTDSSKAQVMQMSTSGAETAGFRSDQLTIYSISRYVGDTFIVGLNGTDANKKEYAVATLSNGSIQLGAKFYVNQIQAYGTGQDVAYIGGDLYIPTWNGTTGNRVLKVKIGEAVKAGSVYQPEEVIQVDTNDPSITKLEIESLDADENGRIVVCTNYETVTNKDTDMIFRLPA